MQRKPPSTSFLRCELAVDAATPASSASTLAASARLSASASRIFARAGSAISDATLEMSVSPCISGYRLSPEHFVPKRNVVWDQECVSAAARVLSRLAHRHLHQRRH